MFYVTYLNFLCVYFFVKIIPFTVNNADPVLFKTQNCLLRKKVELQYVAIHSVSCLFEAACVCECVGGPGHNFISKLFGLNKADF